MKASFKFALAFVLMSFTTLTSATTPQNCPNGVCSANAALLQAKGLGEVGTQTMLVKNKSPFAKTMGTIGNGIGNFFTDILPNVFSAIGKGIGTAWRASGKGIKKGWQGAGRGLASAGSWISKPFRPTYEEVIVPTELQTAQPAEEAYVSNSTITKDLNVQKTGNHSINAFQAVNI